MAVRRIVPGVRQQPQGTGATLNVDNPLAREAKFIPLAVPGGMVDVVGGEHAADESRYGYFTTDATPLGVGLNTNMGAGAPWGSGPRFSPAVAKSASPKGQAGFSVLAVINQTAKSSGQSSFLFSDVYGSTYSDIDTRGGWALGHYPSRYIMFRLRTTSATWEEFNIYTGDAVPADGLGIIAICVAWGADGTLRASIAGRDGKVASAISLTYDGPVGTPGYDPSPNGIYVAGSEVQAERGVYGSFIVGGVWHRTLSQEETASLVANPMQLVAPRRVWVPRHVEAGGAVATQLLGSWPVLAPVAASLPATHQVLAFVRADLAASHSVLTPVVATLDASYAVDQSITSALSSSYAVRESSTAALSGAYPVRESITAPLPASHAVHAPIASTLPGSYDVLADNAVTSQLPGSWSVHAQVAATLAASHQVLASVHANLTGGYATHQTVQALLECAYEVQSQTSVVAQLEGAYAVHAAVESGLAGAYPVHMRAGSDLPGAYAITVPVSTALPGAWPVLAQVWGALDGAYEIQSTGGASASQIWAYVLSNGKTAGQTLVELHAFARDVYRIHGLELGVDLIVTPTTRTAGAIDQRIATAGDQTTVSRH